MKQMGFFELAQTRAATSKYAPSGQCGPTLSHMLAMRGVKVSLAAHSALEQHRIEDPRGYLRCLPGPECLLTVWNRTQVRFVALEDARFAKELLAALVVNSLERHVSAEEAKKQGVRCWGYCSGQTDCVW
jgi:hypothetical protein